MNKKEENTLRKFAAPIGLSVDHNNGVIYGVYQGYHLYLIRANNNSYSFTVNFSLNKAGELPQQDEVKQVVKESKDIIDCVIQGYQVTYTLRGAMTVAKTVDKLEPSLKRSRHFYKKWGIKMPVHYAEKVIQLLRFIPLVVHRRFFAMIVLKNNKKP